MLASPSSLSLQNFTTLQCCKVARVVWVQQLPRQVCKRVQELGPLITLTGDCLRCAPAPYGLWWPQSTLLSSHRTCACNTIHRDGFLRIQHIRIPPLLLEQVFNTLFTEFVHVFIGSLLIPKPRLIQFWSLLLQACFA